MKKKRFEVVKKEIKVIKEIKEIKEIKVKKEKKSEKMSGQEQVYTCETNVVMVSGNKNKGNEMCSIFRQIDPSQLSNMMSTIGLDLKEVQPRGKGELSEEAKEITYEKARECYEIVKKSMESGEMKMKGRTLFIIEDSSFYVLGLDGKGPGPLVKFSSAKALIQMANGCESRKAKAVAQFAYFTYDPDEKNESMVTIKLVEGSCTGEIATEERGNGGFHWDKIFIIDDEYLEELGENSKKYKGLTFSEMIDLDKSNNEKNMAKDLISARRIATKRLYNEVIKVFLSTK